MKPVPTAPDNPARRESLASVGGWPLLVTSFLGRIPSSMVQLGYLMVLSHDGRGLAIGGLAVAVVGLGSAVGAPLLGRAVDRRGPGPVLTLATITSVIAQACFVWALLVHGPSIVLLACAAVVGAANPQIGPVVRSHWSRIAARRGEPGLVTRALGYEGMVDEIGFVIGPVLSSLLVSGIGARTAAVTMIVLTLGLQGAFLVHLWQDRENWPAAQSSGVHGERVRASVSVVWPMVACLGVGVLFGSTQTGLTALFDLRGTPAVTGIVYGCVGVGSGVASILVGRLPLGIPAWTRLVAGAALMVAGTSWLSTLPGSLASCGAAIVLGAGAGITLVSSFGWMERVAPSQRMATWMTGLATCLTLGVSAGAAAAGRLAADPDHCFALVYLSALLGALGALGMWLDRRRRAFLELKRLDAQTSQR